MNDSNALCFLSLGLVMLGLPWLADSVATASPDAGWTARQLWLVCMGMVNAGIGTAWWTRRGWLALEPRLRTVRLALAEASRATTAPGRATGTLRA